ncbi:MAG: hypothetical protein AAGA03_20150, partial [Planctomycetota bacterium]
MKVLASIILATLACCLVSGTSAQSQETDYADAFSAYGGDYVDVSDRPKPTEIVIMLGDGDEAKRREFIDAWDVMESAKLGASTTGIGPATTLSQIRVDIETPYPNGPEPCFVAEYPKHWDETKVAAFRKQAELDALRFGIREYYFQSVEKPDDDNKTRMWLRAGVRNRVELDRQFVKFVQIAKAFDSKNPRLDLFQITTPARDPFSDFGGDPFGGDDPFGGSPAAAARSAQPNDSDPFGSSNDQANSLGALTPAPRHPKQTIAAQIAEAESDFKRASKALVTLRDNFREAATPEKKQEARRAVVSQIAAMFQTRRRIQMLRVQSLHRQLEDLAKSLANDPTSQPNWLES